jgi:ADP-heptose:LPS heptosyltransferase
VEKSALGFRCLLIAHGHTGNNVFCTPAINLLKRHFPKTLIDIVVANKKSGEVFEGNPYLNKVFVMKYQWQIKRIAHLYDNLICLNYKSSQLIQNNSVKSFIVPEIPHDKHHADHILEQIASSLSIDIKPSDRQYFIKPSERSLTSIIGKESLQSESILIGMHLGCARTAIHGWKSIFKRDISHQKLWPIEKYIDLASELRKKNKNIRFFITGTRNEKYLGKMFIDKIDDTINLIGKTHLTDLPIVLNQASAFVTQDCGMLHMACSTNVPLIALFGPTSYVKNGPYPQSRKSIIITKSSMEKIMPKDVAQATLSIIGLNNYLN